jgi:integrase
MPLTDVKPIHIKRFLSSKKDTSHSTITKLKAFLFAIFECAIDNDLCIKNPSRNVKPPIIAQGTKEAFSDVEVDTIFEYAATDEGKWFELAISTFILTGLRRGEVLGLMWDDIDFGTTVLNLRRAVSFGVGRSFIIVTTNCRKNHTREIPIDPFLLSLFKAEKENLDRPKSLYIFSSASGELIKPDNFARTYQKFFRHLNEWCIKNEKPEVRKLTPHECRHTYASLLLRRGVDSRIRQALLGHADEEMTNNYTHTDIDMLIKAAGNIRKI